MAPREWLEGASILEALLQPTRIYVRPVLDALKALPGAIHALAHITGGGISENLDRALPATLDAQVQLGSWPEPPIIRFICDAANLSSMEALKTFNMGVGMVLIVDASRSDELMAHFESVGEEAFIIGSVIPGEGQVVYR